MARLRKSVARKKVYLSMTLLVKIKNPKAKRLLEDLVSLDLIEMEEKDIIKKEKMLTHLASEKSLAKPWDNKKEDEAWQDL